MVELRIASNDDFDFYYSLKCEDSAVYWSGFANKPERNSMALFWNDVVSSGIKGKRRVFILQSEGTKVGYVQAVDNGASYELSLGISESARGRGFGTIIIRKVIELIGINKRYVCYIRSDNVASIKCFEHSGFKKTNNTYKKKYLINNKTYRMEEYLREPKRIIAIIPARSGSKGLKDKNIKEINRKPLLAYTIESATKTGLFDVIHVSTDSIKYAEIATRYGADEPFLRSKDNAGDSSSSWDAVREVLHKYREMGKEFDVCVLLQPTSPLRTADDIKAAYDLYVSKNAECLTSVSEVEHPIQWCFKLGSDCSMREFASSPYKNSRRQELEKYYRENGAIYIVNTANIEDSCFDFYTDKCIAFVMDQSKSLDIDTLQDFLLFESIMAKSRKG